MSPLISICIPAYQNASYLKRLLHSINSQSFRDFEVIITDDSPDDLVEMVSKSFEDKFVIYYYKNPVPLGTPANWNYGISKAAGKWIKIMHHDDWFAQDESLYKFYQAASEAIPFVFSSFKTIDEITGKVIFHAMSPGQLNLLRRSPYNLFKQNFIGHPSTTMILNDRQEWYDEKVKWVVDFDFYIRSLDKAGNFAYINEPLINIGLHELQVTKAVFRKPETEIPENLYLLNKIGTAKLKNICVYDYYWRFLRNLGIRKIADLIEYVDPALIPSQVKAMVSFQALFPLFLLRIGAISKGLMSFSFLYNRLTPTKNQ